MLPSNIIGMSYLKNLDVVAVTDHNTCKNCPAVLKLAEQYNIVAIPGMELCTEEEVHVLCLFDELSDAMEFDEFVSSRLIKIPNDVAVFGKQEIYDEDDNLLGTEPYLLINAAAISFDELGKLMQKYRGIYIPAHLDKNSNSLISNLGFIPPDADFVAAELADITKLDKLTEGNPYLEHCNIITDSDAHMLGKINESVHFINCESRDRKGIIQALKGQKINQPEK
jgi:PHP family Zn ribbon phosphoesterase